MLQPIAPEKREQLCFRCRPSRHPHQRARAVLQPPFAPPGRHRLGHPSPRRPLPGVRLGRALRSLVAEIAAKFIRTFDAARERCWIAERMAPSSARVPGSPDGCCRQAASPPRREPSARGLGLGRRLVQECIDFSRSVGYRQITLWTQAELVAARHIYEKAGFHRTGEKHNHFGPEMVGEVWDMTL